jgi:23S rRNA (cytosine1962-C5)-methyltransferase
MQSKIYLKKNEERRILSGHLWVFSNEIDRIEGDAENGELVEIFDHKSKFLGTGFYNKNSLISVRLLSRSNTLDLSSLIKERILNAYDLRKTLYPDRESYRLVFSESDFLPGLIVDKYNNTFVLQVYSFGMQKNIEVVIEVLKKEFDAENIFSKNELYFRKLEGLPEEDQIYFGEIKEEIISDGALKYKIDFTGQKTGFYFDQSDNRFLIEKFSKGKSVLDAFCNSGGFGLHTSLAGASSVSFVDSSAKAIEDAKYNFKLNDLKSESEFFVSDVFDYLNKCIEEDKKSDIVMLDPPAFAKSKKNLPTAIKGYEKLNKLAISILNGNGFLVTSSCSHHLSENDFMQIIKKATVKTGKRIQLIEFNGASLDHPVLPAMPETSYLKFAVFKVHNA